MKKITMLLLCVVLSAHFTFGQANRSSQQQQSKNNNLTRAASLDKGISAISGAITSSSVYIAGAGNTFNFTLTLTSPDLEYIDGVSLTFPTGITPQTTGTSNPLTTPNGCTGIDLDLNPISGQIVSWGELTTPTGCGGLTQGTYTFSVAALVDAGVTGQQTINFFIMGDGYGATPHSINGTIVLQAAATNDVGTTSVDAPGFLAPAAILTPMATVQNVGTQQQSFPVSFTLNDGTNNVFTDTFNVVNLAAGATQQITFANTWTAIAGNYTMTVTTHLNGDAVNTNDSKNKNLLVGTISEAYSANTTGGLYHTVNVLTGALNNVGTVAANPFPMAEEYNGVNIYRVYNDFSFGTVNPVGDFTLLGTLTGVSGTPTGLAWNWTTSTMYVVVLDASDLPVLCTLNLNTLALTSIGTGTTGMIIGIDFASDGYIYGPSLDPDSLFKIDPATGATTSVGPLGIDINYGQDVSYDFVTNQLYTFTVGAVYQYGTYNLTTGAFSMIAALSGNNQHATYVITNTPASVVANDVMVMSISPIASGCGLSASQDIQITVMNVGTNPQSNIPVYYTINGGTQVTGTITGPLAPGASTSFTFATPANLSAPMAYAIVACTNLPNDDNTNNDCKTINVTSYVPPTLPFSESFEGILFPPACWLALDADGDTYNWERRDDAGWSAQQGTAVAVSASWDNVVLTPDNYLITPPLTITDPTSFLSFWVAAQDIDYPAEKFSVMVSTTTNNVTDFTTTLHTEILSDSAFENITLALTQFVGNTIYIAFRHWDCTDKFFMKIDNVVVDFIVGVEEKTEALINVFPNPTNEIVNVNASDVISNIRILNAIGQLVYTAVVEDYTAAVNVSSFDKGVYILQIETNLGITNKRFLITQ